MIILPQGIRLGIPLLTGKAISITKDTALASVVAVPELLNQMSTEQGIYANPSPLMLGALIFLAMFLPVVQGSRWLERRYRWARRATMNAFATTFLNFGSVVQVFPLLLAGLRISAQLILSIVPAAMLLGLLLAMLQQIGGRAIRHAIIAYTDFFRSFPPLVLLDLPVFGTASRRPCASTSSRPWSSDSC